MLQWHRYAHPERIAYAMWSALAEGTLGEAHRLIGAHGPVEALDVVARWAERGPHPTFTAAVERWTHRRSRIDIDALIDTHLSYGGFLLTPGDAGYRFADLGEQAPLALWARGKNFSALVSAVPPEWAFANRIPNCGVIELTPTDTGWRCLRWGSLDEVPGPV